MRTYRWWRSQKPRVRKKYTLVLGRYLSPKEVKAWYKDYPFCYGGAEMKGD